MKPEPRPMDPDRLEQIEHHLRTCSPMPYGVRGYRMLVQELLSDRAWHRARVAVTDDDIRAAGLGDPAVCEECPRLVAWIAAHGLHVVNTTNDDDSWFEHGIWSGDPRSSDARPVVEASAMAHDWIINALSSHLCRAPLDVLAEIAATEVSDG